MPKISVTCVTYNSAKFIGQCLDSLKEQSFRDFETVIIDNASSDGTGELIEKQYPQFRLVRNQQNFGYCKAQNLAIGMSKGDYVLTLNPDIILDKDFLANMIGRAETYPGSGSFSPKLLQLKDGIRTDIIDSMGHIMEKNRCVKNIGSGNIDKGQFEEIKYVFGVSGAAALYRKKMLESIKYRDEYLDEDFFMGYDDVDIDWRARNKGWKALYNPKSVAWHVRSASTKKSSRKWLYYNYRNRYLTIIKNDSFAGLLANLPFVLVYEIGIVLSMAVQLLIIKVFAGVIRLIPKMAAKRAASHGKEKARSK